MKTLAKTLARLLLAIGFAIPACCQAQTYPSRLIKIIVPSPAGATTDTLARIIAEKLQVKWGQPVIVDPRGGAGGNIGAEEAFKAAGDGYTLLFSYPAPLAVNKSLYATLSYDPDRFVPVTLVAVVPLVLAVTPKLPASDVRELIAFAHAHPKELNYASQGYGTTGHLAGELFKSMAGVEIVHVPYKGSTPALTDLLGGQVDMMFIELSTVLPYIEAGKLRALAVGSEQRNRLLPDVPAMAEVLPTFQASTWFGMVAPPATPPQIVEALAATIAAAIREPDAAKRFSAMSAEAVGDTPAQMALFLRQERERWSKIIRATGAKAE
ncbi:MAG TPA: tripartite tricarboxylate transporter substrate binding protein [Xanthobacteraceae bacterium]|nr:tripartite tricarboxylate transporter substrate binding protein [Xanthobacteraceae bacterium]